MTNNTAGKALETGPEGAGTRLLVVTRGSGGDMSGRTPGKAQEVNRDEANCRRLRGLMLLFRLSMTDVAKAAGLSRPLVSRVLAGDPGVNPATLFDRLERKIEELIARRQSAYFEVAAVPVEAVEASVQAIKDQAEA